MQKLMSLVLSATMFAYMACGETPHKNTDNKTQIRQKKQKKFYLCRKKNKQNTDALEKCVRLCVCYYGVIL